MVKKRIIFLVMLILFNFTGCNENLKSNSNEKKSDSAAVSVNKPDNSKKNYYLKTSIPITSRNDQWKDLKIISMDAILKDNRGWTPMGISNDGKIVVYVPVQNNKQPEIGIFDISNKSYELIKSLTVQAQPGYSDINSNWIVWSEIVDQSWLNWKIHAYNRNTRKDKVIYENVKDKSGNGYSGLDEVPTLSGDKVLWSAVLGSPINGTPNISLMEYNLKNGKITNLSIIGANPIESNGVRIWLGKDNENPNNNRSALYWNKDGSDKQITTNKSVAFFTTDGSLIAWSGHDPYDSEEWVINLFENGQNKTLFKTSNTNAIQFLSMGSRFLAWNSYNEVQVYDRKINKIITLEDHDAGYSTVFVNNRYLYWTMPLIEDDKNRDTEGKQNGIIKDKINIIDLNNLK